MTKGELAAALGIDKRNVLEYLRLWREDGKVYICSWVRCNGKDTPGDHTPQYALRTEGEKDKPRPKPMTDAQKHMRYQRRNRAKIRMRYHAARGQANMFTPLTIKVLE